MVPASGIGHKNGTGRTITVYLSPMIDCFDGMVVSWSIGTRPNAELVNTTLDAAV